MKPIVTPQPDDTLNRQNPDDVYVCGYCRAPNERLRKVRNPGRCTRDYAGCAGETFLVLQ